MKTVVSNAQLLRDTEAFFHEKMPITQAMGLRVDFYAGHQLILTAPLALNHNHLGTAFGGSLAAVATLAGYGLIWLELNNRDVHVVIRDSALSYRRPVRGDIRAICRRPDEVNVAAFKTALEQKGKARILLDVTIESDNAVAVEFQGTFVALR